MRKKRTIFVIHCFGWGNNFKVQSKRKIAATSFFVLFLPNRNTEELP